MELWGKQAPARGSSTCNGPEAQGSTVGQGSRKETTVFGAKEEKGPHWGASSSNPNLY